MTIRSWDGRRRSFLIVLGPLRTPLQKACLKVRMKKCKAEDRERIYESMTVQRSMNYSYGDYHRAIYLVKVQVHDSGGTEPLVRLILSDANQWEISDDAMKSRVQLADLTKESPSRMC